MARSSSELHAFCKPFRILVQVLGNDHEKFLGKDDAQFDSSIQMRYRMQSNFQERSSLSAHIGQQPNFGSSWLVVSTSQPCMGYGLSERK